MGGLLCLFGEGEGLGREDRVGLVGLVGLDGDG